MRLEARARAPRGPKRRTNDEDPTAKHLTGTVIARRIAKVLGIFKKTIEIGIVEVLLNCRSLVVTMFSARCRHPGQETAFTEGELKTLQKDFGICMCVYIRMCKCM